MNPQELLDRWIERIGQGAKPDRFCSFGCDCSDQDKAQHAACQAFNGIWCSILEATVEKGLPCWVRTLLRRSGFQLVN